GRSARKGLHRALGRLDRRLQCRAAAADPLRAPGRCAHRPRARPGRDLPSVAPRRSAGGDPRTRGPRPAAHAGTRRDDAGRRNLDRVPVRRAGHAPGAARGARGRPAQPRPGALSRAALAQDPAATSASPVLARPQDGRHPSGSPLERLRTRVVQSSWPGGDAAGLPHPACRFPRFREGRMEEASPRPPRVHRPASGTRGASPAFIAIRACRCPEADRGGPPHMKANVLTLACLVAASALLACDRLAAPGAVAAVPDVSPPEMAMIGAHLLDGLGDYRFEVTTRHPDVQRWFDQGMMLAYGFNHDAAERSFLMATELDPDCAMCWWGASLVLGPHVNAAMDPADNADAWQRLQRARELAPAASEREQAFIQALSARYAEQPPEDRRALDEAYAAAARELAGKRPDDADAAVFLAEALMDLQPWDYYDAQQKPKGHTAEVVRTLESVMARAPDHAGALHLYVHAVEASADPQRGADAADRLRTL